MPKIDQSGTLDVSDLVGCSCWQPATVEHGSTVWTEADLAALLAALCASCTAKLNP